MPKILVAILLALATIVAANVSHARTEYWQLLADEPNEGSGDPTRTLRCDLAIEVHDLTGEWEPHNVYAWDCVQDGASSSARIFRHRAEVGNPFIPVPDVSRLCRPDSDGVTPFGVENHCYWYQVNGVASRNFPDIEFRYNGSTRTHQVVTPHAQGNGALYLAHTWSVAAETEVSPYVQDAVRAFDSAPLCETGPKYTIAGYSRDSEPDALIHWIEGTIHLDLPFVEIGLPQTWKAHDNSYSWPSADAFEVDIWFRSAIYPVRRWHWPDGGSNIRLRNIGGADPLATIFSPIDGIGHSFELSKGSLSDGPSGSLQWFSNHSRGKTLTLRVPAELPFDNHVFYELLDEHAPYFDNGCVPPPSPRMSEIVDSDGDGIPNHDDPDLDQDGEVLVSDFLVFLADYQTGIDSGTGSDLDCDGAVTASDFFKWLPYYTDGWDR